MQRQFAKEGFEGRPVGQHEQRTSVAVLDLLPDGEDGDEENHQREHARSEDVGEIDIVVERRIADRVGLHYDGLEHGHGLPRSGAACQEGRASGRSARQFAHGAHVLVEQ